MFLSLIASNIYGQEICNDAIDNNNNGLIDCRDSALCNSDPICQAKATCGNINGIHGVLTTSELDCVAKLLEDNAGCYDHVCYNKNDPLYINDVTKVNNPNYDTDLCNKCMTLAAASVCWSYGNVTGLNTHKSATDCNRYTRSRYTDPMTLPVCNQTGEVNGTFTDEEFQCVLSNISNFNCKQSVCWDSNQGIYTDRDKYIENKNYDAALCSDCRTKVPLYCAEFGQATGGATNIEATNCVKQINAFLEQVQETKDTDGDTVYDHLDNCPTVKNKNQDDTNLNGIGDACEPGGPDECNSTNFTEKSTCDIITTDEKQALSTEFNSVNVILTLPNFTFKSNSINTNRNCSIGEIKVGNTLLVDCSTATQQDPKYVFCEQGCNMKPDDNCFYYANITVPPNLVKSIAINEIGTQDFFDNPDTEIKLNIDIFIDSDYLASSPGKYNEYIDTTSGYQTTKNICNADIFVKKERAIVTAVNCQLIIGTTRYDNILNLQDYQKAASKNSANCKL